MCLPLSYTAIATPYHVAMPGERASTAVYVLDRFVDCLFILDILFSFSLAYRSPRTGGMKGMQYPCNMHTPKAPAMVIE